MSSQDATSPPNPLSTCPWRGGAVHWLHAGEGHQFVGEVAAETGGGFLRAGDLGAGDATTRGEEAVELDGGAELLGVGGGGECAAGVDAGEKVTLGGDDAAKLRTSWLRRLPRSSSASTSLRAKEALRGGSEE
jgi:hypothetical protein